MCVWGGGYGVRAGSFICGVGAVSAIPGAPIHCQWSANTLPPAHTVTSLLRKTFPSRKYVPAKMQTHFLENLGSLGLIPLGKVFSTRNGGKYSLIYKRSDVEKVWC